MSEVVGILARTQHASLTALSDCMEDSTFEGLTAAAREARRRGLIPAALARKCERLDVAAHYARHTTTAKGAAFIKVLTTALPGPTGVSPACHRPTAEDLANGLDLYTGEQVVEELIDPEAASQGHTVGTIGIGKLIWTMPSTSKPGMNEAPIGGYTGDTSTVAPTGEGSTMESTVTGATLGTTGAYPTELPLPPLDVGDPAGCTRVASTGAPTVVYTGQGYAVSPAGIGLYWHPLLQELPVGPLVHILQRIDSYCGIHCAALFVGELSEHPTGGSMGSNGGEFREPTSDESITPAASTERIAPSTARPGHCHNEGMFAWMAEPQSTAQRNLRFHLKK